MQAVRVFDELMANAYRNIDPAFDTSTMWDNLLITKGWDVWLIDHTRTFRTITTLEHSESLIRCDRTMLGRLRALNRDALGRALGRYLTAEQLDSLDVRRGLIVTHFDERIARLGEAAVLYDLPARPTK